MGQREKLNCMNVVANKSKPDPSGSSRTGEAVQSCPELRQENWALAPARWIWITSGRQPYSCQRQFLGRQL